ncbi:hypothetical protein [Salipiger bermudensis]|uniref:hypothetical protein n=1 Tax=Salipiger bermudensis TaxID=344736 RepID=UPI001CD660E2|nr:hypothetical protein [Salipiger bermudensis]MCA0964215.1 hypothetical protein [Salipiger bermudensis]
MATQLLLQFPSFDPSEFDSDAENRANAGLTLLQRWTEESGSGQWLLFSVNDIPKAKNWLETSSALGHGPAASHFLRTA